MLRDCLLKGRGDVSGVEVAVMTVASTVLVEPGACRRVRFSSRLRFLFVTVKT